MLGACATSSPPTDLEQAQAPANGDTYRLWEESTRSLADDLMLKARRLALGGDSEGAMAFIDDAICTVVSTPPDYQVDGAYTEYLAQLIDEADDIESITQPMLVDSEGARDLVILPPIDLYVDESAELSAAEVEGGPLPDSDYPLLINPTVERFLQAMSAEGEYRRRIEVGLSRAGAYLPMIREKFSDAGLPLDIGYLPLIESAFSLKAYSRARAHGMWQFIASTGRHYGLEIGSLIDERRDPEKATEAAVAYLSDLYKQFGDWHLALAAYNSGAGNVRRAIRRSGSRDFWTLRRYLPRETRNYVPAFIASVIVAKRPEKYGFEPPQGEPWQFETFEVPDALDLEFLADGTGIAIDELRDLNPAVRRDLTPARVATSLRLPRGTSDSARKLLDETPRNEWAPRMIHTVRSGDNLYSIARRYGSTVSAIRQANGLRGSLIRPGQRLLVPRFPGSTPAAAPANRRASNDGTYTVRKNDTLWDIARAFSISLDQLCAANGLSRRSVIKPGQTLVIPGSSGGAQPRTASTAKPSSSGRSHTVANGDTLYDIARNYGVSVDDLKRLNGLSGSRIHPGQQLEIPSTRKASGSGGSGGQQSTDTRTYRVRRGDTLYDIARRFGVSVAALRSANGLRSSRIYPGDVLRIPPANAKS
ncbi:MAG: LysM peptidoglycan-binding domain-containing protein [Holophagae bacterium]|jgi:membrane-bound lytic murein transglycosylase D